jgi:uncharacterized protein
MALFNVMAIDGLEPIEEEPEPRAVLSGRPHFRTWVVDEAPGGVVCGVWEATPGKWRFKLGHWEYCRILSGVSVVTEEGGAARTVRAGDAFVLQPGLRGTWEVVETTRKEFVIRE